LSELQYGSNGRHKTEFASGRNEKNIKRLKEGTDEQRKERSEEKISGTTNRKTVQIKKERQTEEVKKRPSLMPKCIKSCEKNPK
jgi:hypothetical protein